MLFMNLNLYLLVVDVIYADKSKEPKFVHIGQLAWDVIEDLKSLHEEWAGTSRHNLYTQYTLFSIKCGTRLLTMDIHFIQLE